MSRLVCEAVCFKQGHQMGSLETGKPTVDPVAKLVLYEKKICCLKCGLSLEQIQNYRPLPKNRKGSSKNEEQP